MISRIKFKNFRSYADWTELYFRPITIFVGPNSAGKSTILKLLNILFNSENILDIAAQKNRPYGKRVSSVHLDIDFKYQKDYWNLLTKSKKNSEEELSLSYEFKTTNKYKIIDQFEGLSKFALKEIESGLSFKFMTKDPLIKELLGTLPLGNNVTSSTFKKWPFLWEKTNLESVIKKHINNILLRQLILKIFNVFFVQTTNPSIFQINNIMPMDFEIIWPNSKTIRISENNNKFDKEEEIVLLGNNNNIFSKFYFLKKDNFNAIKEIAYQIENDLKSKQKNTSYLDAIPEILEEYDLVERFANYLGAFDDKKIDQYFGAMIMRLKKLEKKIENLDEHPLKEKFVNDIIILIVGRFFTLTGGQLGILHKNKLNKINTIISHELHYAHIPAVRDQLIRKAFAIEYRKEFYKKMYAPLIKEDLTAEFINVDRVNYFLKRFGSDYMIVEPKSNKDTKFLLKDIRTGQKVEINDIGFGFSQIIPVILESIMLENSRKILIEQPEAQLHPKLQSRLADLFFTSAIKNKNQLFIETHSEYLIRRFQVLISQGKMSPEDIVIYYISKDEKGHSHAQEMELDDSGQFLTEWPSGFFDESYKHAIEMLR